MKRVLLVTAVLMGLATAAAAQEAVPETKPASEAVSTDSIDIYGRRRLEDSIYARPEPFRIVQEWGLRPRIVSDTHLFSMGDWSVDFRRSQDIEVIGHHREYREPSEQRARMSLPFSSPLPYARLGERGSLPPPSFGY